jgi:Ca2+-binding EF-hand superfamily protein
LVAGAGWSASERELEEAFHVFDRGEDGFICAAELWAVMRRLGVRGLPEDDPRL